MKKESIDFFEVVEYWLNEKIVTSANSILNKKRVKIFILSKRMAHIKAKDKKKKKTIKAVLKTLFRKIMTLLKTKNIEVDGILQHRGKAEEVFRELTLNPKQKI